LKKLLLISYSNLSTDPRVLRQYQALQHDFEVYTAGLSALSDQVPFIPLNVEPGKQTIRFHLNFPTPIRKFVSLGIRILTSLRKLKADKFYESKYWGPMRKQALTLLSVQSYDLIIANDIDTLPLCLAMKKSFTKVILDSHEYHPLEFEENADWMRESRPFVEFLCKKYLPKADLMFTVCKGIADAYLRNYSVNPILISNATRYSNLSPSPVSASRIRLIHHGIAIPARNIEGMIEMMRYLDNRFTLDLMLMPTDPAYFERLKQLAASKPNIRFVDTVPTNEIAERINGYDIGLFLLPPVNFNYKHALPNKFFEFIQARLAIAIGPSPEMAIYVKQYGLGLISNSFSPLDLASDMNRLDVLQIELYKRHAHENAESLSAEKNKHTIRLLALELCNSSTE
jgi:hypothetical protein